MTEKNPLDHNFSDQRQPDDIARFMVLGLYGLSNQPLSRGLQILEDMGRLKGESKLYRADAIVPRKTLISLSGYALDPGVYARFKYENADSVKQVDEDIVDMISREPGKALQLDTNPYTYRFRPARNAFKLTIPIASRSQPVYARIMNRIRDISPGAVPVEQTGPPRMSIRIRAPLEANPDGVQDAINKFQFSIARQQGRPGSIALGSLGLSEYLQVMRITKPSQHDA